MNFALSNGVVIPAVGTGAFLMSPEQEGNADVLDFCLTDGETAVIQALNTNSRFYNPPADMEERYVTFAIDLDAQS